MCDLFVLRVDSLFLLLLPSTSIFDQRYVVLPLASYQICHGCHKLNWATHCLARVHFENISSDDNLNSIQAILDPVGSEFMEKTFQAAQLTHERFLTIDHFCKIFFWYLPNWTSTNLWCVVLYVTYSTTHQR